MVDLRKNFIDNIEQNNLDFIKKTIKYIDIHYNNDHILSRAAKHGNIEIVKFIYNSSTDFNIDRVFLYSIAGIMKNDRNKQYEVCDYLISLGTNIHYDNDRPFKYAIEQGNIDMLLFLVLNGIDLNYIKDFQLRTIIIKNLRIHKLKKINI